jgi:hypothetical protein
MSNGLESSGLKFLACCSIDITNVSTLLLSNSFTRIFYLWTKDKPRWMTSFDLSKKPFLMHILFLVIHIIEVGPFKTRESSLKTDPKLPGTEL